MFLLVNETTTSIKRFLLKISKKSTYSHTYLLIFSISCFSPIKKIYFIKKLNFKICYLLNSELVRDSLILGYRLSDLYQPSIVIY